LSVARRAKRELARLARPSKNFDASRYFRGDAHLGFYNVGTPRMRALAKSIHREHRGEWSLDDALEFAEPLIRDRYLEAKSVGIEVLAAVSQGVVSARVADLQTMASRGPSANWATTDAICGYLIGPVVASNPALTKTIAGWAADRNPWVRRASAVALIPSLRGGANLDVAYEVATRLQSDREDLIQKAVGWMLREAGKVDPQRLQRYLIESGPAIPRTTVRYAIERFARSTRARLLEATRNGR
jgi:3-methyladenine DNA glycosylase AlkD